MHLSLAPSPPMLCAATSRPLLCSGSPNSPSPAAPFSKETLVQKPWQGSLKANERKHLMKICMYVVHKRGSEDPLPYTAKLAAISSSLGLRGSGLGRLVYRAFHMCLSSLSPSRKVVSLITKLLFVCLFNYSYH